jgi:hypothetical protein
MNTKHLRRCAALLREAATEIERLRNDQPERGLQPIDTAPKDGTLILVFAVSVDDPYDRQSTFAEAWWGDDGSRDPRWISLGLTDWHVPTHWMPRPSNPAGYECPDDIDRRLG